MKWTTIPIYSWLCCLNCCYLLSFLVSVINASHRQTSREPIYPSMDLRQQNFKYTKNFYWSEESPARRDRLRASRHKSKRRKKKFIIHLLIDLVFLGCPSYFHFFYFLFFFYPIRAYRIYSFVLSKLLILFGINLVLRINPKHRWDCHKYTIRFTCHMMSDHVIEPIEMK